MKVSRNWISSALVGAAAGVHAHELRGPSMVALVDDSAEAIDNGKVDSFPPKDKIGKDDLNVNDSLSEACLKKLNISKDDPEPVFDEEFWHTLLECRASELNIDNYNAEASVQALMTGIIPTEAGTGIQVQTTSLFCEKDDEQSTPCSDSLIKVGESAVNLGLRASGLGGAVTKIVNKMFKGKKVRRKIKKEMKCIVKGYFQHGEEYAVETADLEPYSILSTDRAARGIDYFSTAAGLFQVMKVVLSEFKFSRLTQLIYEETSWYEYAQILATTTFYFFSAGSALALKIISMVDVVTEVYNTVTTVSTSCGSISIDHNPVIPEPHQIPPEENTDYVEAECERRKNALHDCIGTTAETVFLDCLHKEDSEIKTNQKFPTFAPTVTGATYAPTHALDLESSIDHFVDHHDDVAHLTCDAIVDCIKSDLPPDTCESELTAEIECWLYEHTCERAVEEEAGTVRVDIFDHPTKPHATGLYFQFDAAKWEGAFGRLNDGTGGTIVNVDLWRNGKNVAAGPAKVWKSGAWPDNPNDAIGRWDPKAFKGDFRNGDVLKPLVLENCGHPSSRGRGCPCEDTPNPSLEGYCASGRCNVIFDRCAPGPGSDTVPGCVYPWDCGSGTCIRDLFSDHYDEGWCANCPGGYLCSCNTNNDDCKGVLKCNEYEGKSHCHR